MVEREFHQPVLLAEVLDGLDLLPGQRVIDATVGGGGHSRAIAERIGPDGALLCLDQDPESLAQAQRILAGSDAEIFFEHCNFEQIEAAAAEHGFESCEAILADLGVSSNQLDQAQRGFSFQHDAPLDMRMDPEHGESAAELLNRVDEVELARILFQLGEEKASRRLARAIKADGPREWTTAQLVAVVESQLGGRGGRRIHPATKTFQALRLAVNRELEVLDRLLEAAPGLLRPGGRLAIISFHSLEDRRVKRSFRELATDCSCPPEWPVCQCGGRSDYELVSRRAIKPSIQEQESNPRSRSARLRVLRRRIDDE